MIWLSLFLSFCAFVALSLAMNKHHQQVFATPVSTLRKALLRLLGGTLLLLSMLPCLHSWGPSVGLAIWCVQLTLAAQALGLLLTYRPRWTLRASALGSALSVFSAVLLWL